MGAVYFLLKKVVLFAIMWGLLWLWRADNVRSKRIYKLSLFNALSFLVWIAGISFLVLVSWLHETEGFRPPAWLSGGSSLGGFMFVLMPGISFLLSLVLCIAAASAAEGEKRWPFLLNAFISIAWAISFEWPN